MSRNSWLAGRAALAIGLMVSFYVLACGVSFGLLWLAYLDLTRTKHPAIRLIAFCVAGAGSVLWAIVPRRDRFEPPGPRLTAEDQPELFAMIHDVATATSQPMPADVYLTNDVNAFVTQRDGIMGVGGRRVMGLGLPLMQSLSVDEFKGVLAHEFGHYHAGDVALGPWIYKTHGAMARTIVQLSESVLRFIFIGFATLFLRVTHAVSRRQEFIADELAARVVGPQAMASGLRKVGVAAFAYQHYWYSELLPVIRAGFRPPLAAGFDRYAASPRVSSVSGLIATQQETAATTSAYDTHPSLKDRVAALQRLPPRPPGDGRPATALLRNVEGCERQLFGALSADLANLAPLDWTRVGDAVYMPLWQARVQQHGARLRGYTILNPPASQRELQQIGRGILPAEGDDASRQSVAWQLIVAAFVLALRPLGWIAETLPGDEAVLRRGADELRPFSELEALMAGRVSAAQWQQRCAVLGIGALPLGADPVEPRMERT
jgi:heat shock protein HtpX